MAKKIITRDVEITEVSRMGTSPNGNPTYKIITATGETFRTATDAQIGYAATNFTPDYGKSRPVTLTLEVNRKYDYVINIVDRETAK